MIRCGLLALTASILTLAGFGQAAPYTITKDSLYRHESILASDSLEGRQVGSEGEQKAMRYIIAEFNEAGLEPKGADGGWTQSFEFIRDISFGKDNRLVVNGVPLALNEDFEPMRQSANGPFQFTEIVDVDYGIKTDEEDGHYDDYEGKDVAGKAVIIKRFTPSAEDNPHVDFSKYESLTSKINTALDHDVAGIFFITPEDRDDTLAAIGPVRISPKEVPIVFLRRAALEKLGVSLTRPQIDSISGAAELVKIRDTGYNVIGYLPGQTDTTIIIGAHYDHLGWGGPGSGSRYLAKEPMIHYGADDNGSGSSLLLEMAKAFASQDVPMRHSLLFIAFSGEEAGILGSSHFAKEMTIDSSKILMMVNMDMVGRLAEQENGLAVLGTGTTEAFGAYFDSLQTDVKITQKKAGQGPSDHTAFYNRGIPVLFFFTGAHEDYHKPADTYDKIDYDGLVKVGEIVKGAVDYFDTYQGELTFTKTKDPDEGKRRSSFSVTLGVMPDYIAEVKGLKVDDVSPDRPADKAGIKSGDIITRMGDIQIGDIYDYMNALGRFRKGDTVSVTVQREGQAMDVTVVFE